MALRKAVDWAAADCRAVRVVVVFELWVVELWRGKLTPRAFEQRMHEICKGSDLNRVALFGMNLVDEALGNESHNYLPALCDYFTRLSELKGQVRREFGPPTTESIAASHKPVDGRQFL